MKFINLSIVKFSICLVLGILAAHFFSIDFSVIYALLGCFLLVFIFWIIAKKQFIQTIYFGIFCFLCFFCIGFLCYQMRLPQFQPQHYIHSKVADSTKIIQLKIKQSLKPDTYNSKYLAEVIAAHGKSTSGKIVLHISKDPLQKICSPDEVLIVSSKISEIPKPLNPHQFDYSKYMKSLGVYGHIHISKKEILKTQMGKRTILGFAQNFRTEIVEKLQHTKLKPDERAIIQALILGEKKDIDKNLYHAYAAAGAVHILAVSGLHVGILYLIIAFLLKPITRWKYGRVTSSILAILLLWSFAMLSGMSPSVTRAVTMFSFFAAAKLFNRETNAINTLFLSFLLLLIINPLWLFHVGFQLSYLAVFFIVWLQPIFYKVGYSRYWFLRKLWSIVTVTLCAQIGVLPLSLYYFHQFPGLFLLTNIVVLPFLTVLMCGGLLVVCLATFKILPDWIAEGYNFMIKGLNNLIHWVAVQDDFLFKDIPFSALKVLGAYVLIVALAFLFQKITYRRTIISCIAVSLLLLIYVSEAIQTAPNRLVIFQMNKHTILGYKKSDSLIIFRSDSTHKLLDKYPVKSYRSALAFKGYSEKKLPGIFRYRDKTILVIDTLGLIPKQKNIHTLLLIGSPKINLNRLIDSLRPKHIIADGSNYPSYARRWKNTCELKKLPFWHTAKQGAFSLE